MGNFTKEDFYEMKEYLEEGLTASEISKIMDWSLGTILEYRKYDEVPMYLREYTLKWGIKHANIIINKRFRAVREAVEWGKWNYKGNNFDIVNLSKLDK